MILFNMVVRLASCIQGPWVLPSVASYLQQLASKIPTKLGERAEELRSRLYGNGKYRDPPIFQWAELSPWSHLTA